jgi:hypothetical protein
MTTHSRRILIGSGFMIAALLAGCTAESGARVDSARADTASRAVDSQGASGVNADANRTPPSTDSSRAGSANAVTFLGAPPLRVGMSEGEARKALGMPASSSASNDECRYLDTKGKSRVYAMLIRDTVARLDVRDSTLATEAGARIGDAESRVTSLYGGRVATQPHKYVSGGHYLVVNSPADTMRRLVFETDGKRVTSYRVGRMPEVMWVEGCS